jgi:hypothetical protein
VDTLGRSAPAAMGVATCYDQEGQILRLNAKGIIEPCNPCLTDEFREVSVKILKIEMLFLLSLLKLEF